MGIDGRAYAANEERQLVKSILLLYMYIRDTWIDRYVGELIKQHLGIA